MIEVIWSSDFRKKYKVRVAKETLLHELFWDALESFANDPFASHLNTHRLGGRLAGYWAFRVDNDCRLVFRFISKSKVLLIDIGTHEEVY